MRLRIAALLALLLALSSESAFAQGVMTYGVKGGIGFASVSFENDEAAEDVDGMRTGVLIGGFVDIPVNNMFSITVEGLYTQKGATSSFEDPDFDFDYTLKLDYFEIPILLNFPFSQASSTRPFVYVGFAPAFNISAKEVETFDGEEEENEIEEIKSADVGIVFGGGVQFGQFAIEARYNLGLTNINSDDDFGSVKNRQFAILGGFSFGQ